MTILEKDLDRVLEMAVRSQPLFASWFVGHTGFADRGATYLWSRSDHPWGNFPIVSKNSRTNELEKTTSEGETDILAIFEARDKRRLALHIENKRHGQLSRVMATCAPAVGGEPKAPFEQPQRVGRPAEAARFVLP